jgi:Tol biopolymer transport system component
MTRASSAARALLLGALLVGSLSACTASVPLATVTGDAAVADRSAAESNADPSGDHRRDAGGIPIFDDTAPAADTWLDAAAVRLDAGGASHEAGADAPEAVPAADAGALEAGVDAPAIVPDASAGLPDAGIDSPPAVPDMASGALPPGFMRALLIGQSQHAGTMVRFSGVAAPAVTEADGRFPLPNPADGTYEALFSNGEYEERIPQLTVRSGSTFVKNRYGSEQAFPTVELPRAHRIHDGDQNSFQYDISPSGARLLLVQTTTPDMSRMSLRTGDARSGSVIATGALGVASFLDEDHLFFARAPNGWFSPWTYQSMPAGGGNEVKVLAAVVNHEYPRFVQGGTKILYRAPGATMATVTLSRSDGTDAKVLGSGPVDYGQISADGNWLAFRTRDAPAEQLRLCNLRDGSTRVVASGLGAFVDYEFTPNSQRLVYQAGTISSVTVEGGTPNVLGSGDDHILSPEGSLVLFQERYTQPLKVVPVEGGTPRAITVDTPTSSLGLHKFSSDGRYVFFKTVDGLKAAATGGLDVQILTSDYNGEVIGYSPIGHTAFFTGTPTGGTKGLYRMPLDRSGAREVLAAPVGDPWTSPRGRYLFFSNLDQAAPTLSLVDLQTGQTRTFRPGGSRPVFSSDETRLLFGAAGKVWVGNVTDGTQVAVGDAKFFYPEVFSPDGSRVTFRADQVFTAAASDGSITTPIARWVNAGTGFIRWMGNRQIVFSTGPFADPPPFIDGLYVAPVP